jgi:hypothetical protein
MMFIDRKVPATMFSHSPDYTHHTSEDTPDKVDPVELERSELIAAATALYLSDLSGAEAIDLAHLVAANGAARLAGAARTARQRVLNGGTGASRRDAGLTIEQQYRWEQAALADVTHFNALPLVRDRVAALQRGLDDRTKELMRMVDADARALGLARDGSQAADGRVPVRLTRGPLDFGLPESRLPADAAAWYASDAFTLSGDARFELVNFVDGKSTVSQIRDALAAEFGTIDLAAVSRYFEDLVRTGVMSWR